MWNLVCNIVMGVICQSLELDISESLTFTYKWYVELLPWDKHKSQILGLLSQMGIDDDI